jgi:hypothetical protein
LPTKRATQRGEGGQALEDDNLAEAQANEKARKDIDDARKAEKITGNDEQQLMLAPYKHPTRLAATVARLGLDDALDVYPACVHEKRDIWAEIASAYYASVSGGKRSEKEYKALPPRIKQFFQDRP